MHLPVVSNESRNGQAGACRAWRASCQLGGFESLPPMSSAADDAIIVGHIGVFENIPID